MDTSSSTSKQDEEKENEALALRYHIIGFCVLVKFLGINGCQRQDRIDIDGNKTFLM